MKLLCKFFTSITLFFVFTSCELDLLPKTTYYQGEEKEESETPYTTRGDMEGLRNSIYDGWIGTISYVGTLYYQMISECRLDNAYNGTTHAKLRDIESNNITSTNEDITITWTRYFQQINNANTILCNIDYVFENDEMWTNETEKNQWKAEAFIYRSWLWLQAVSLWGNIPMITEIPESITASNIEDVYHLYYPKTNTAEEVYNQVIEDLTFACKWAMDTNVANKGQFSKAFAHGMLARLYSRDTELRDWDKVAEHCQAVENAGYTLSPKYDDIWGFDPTGDAYRNNPETIFELQSTKSQSDRLAYMYYYNQYSNKDSFTWAKYLTPSRDLIANFDEEGDMERKNASIKYDQCNWSLYYPSINYPFAYKVRTNASSIIFMRLGEIYLLHAEALAYQKDFSGATEYVNKIRRRVHIDEIDTPSDYDKMVDIILHERRLELAFEGHRFFDVARYGWKKVKDIHDTMHEKDSYWQLRRPFTEYDLLLPIPQNELDKNPNLKQNKGY